MRVLTILLLLAFLVGCGGSSGSTDQAPIEQVKAFVKATEARDVDAMVALLTPQTRRDAGWQLRQVMPKVQTFEYRQAQYELSSNDGTKALVQVSGLIVATTTDGKQVEQSINQLIELEKIDGTWYISSNGVQIPPMP